MVKNSVICAKSMSLGDDVYIPSESVIDEQGQLLYEEEKIKESWAQYFEELLNPGGNHDDATNYQPKFTNSHDPEIIERS
jgi:hypothetical protein